MPLRRRLAALLCLLLTVHLTVAGALGACTMPRAMYGGSSASAPDHGGHDGAHDHAARSPAGRDDHARGSAHGPADGESPTPHGGSAACLSAAGCAVAAAMPTASELPSPPAPRARVAPRAERVPRSAPAAPELPPPRV